jgi:hypothetical protein
MQKLDRRPRRPMKPRGGEQIGWYAMALAVIISMLTLFQALQPHPSPQAGLAANPGNLQDQQLPRIETGVPVAFGSGAAIAAVCIPAQANETAASFASSAPFSSSFGEVSAYHPKESRESIHPTNYGDRFKQDVDGQPVDQSLLIVLHETVGSVGSAINTFRVPHYRDSDQSSYHTLVALDGEVIYLVPPEKRAYGAGNSEFMGVDGPESVKTKQTLASSVNNFSYHISLETPEDGQLTEADTHSGYTDLQYRSLAWLIARTRVPLSRITTHRTIDRQGARNDPRSFDYSQLLRSLQDYPGFNQLPTPCTGKEQAS